MSRYTEFAVTTNFSFLRGASHPRDLVIRALSLGHAGIGIADRNSVAGVVRAYSALKDIRRDGLPAPEKTREGSGPGEHAWVRGVDPGDWPFDPDIGRKMANSFRLVVGARLVFEDGAPEILVYPQDRDGWGRLCRLLTSGNRKIVDTLETKKGECRLVLDDLLSDARSLLLIVAPPRRLDGFEAYLRRIDDVAGGRVWISAAMRLRGDDRRRLARLTAISRSLDIPLLATNDVLYATPAQRDLQDVLTCVRDGVEIAAAGRRLEVNAERHLKSTEEMTRLFRDAPEAIKATRDALDSIAFSLDQIKYEYPEEPVPPGWKPQAWLEHLTWRRAEVCYPAGVPAKVDRQLREELRLIGELDCARYFLTIHDIVRYAEDNRILCQGRGSAANSAVCYVLGVTCVDPAENELLFARFMSKDRQEPPDIDVDFEHERREEVIQHIYKRYGRERAGIIATVIHYRPRSAIRDVGKALGLTEDVTARLAETLWGSWGHSIDDKHMRRAGVDPDNPLIRRAASLATRLLGFPRHLSQHVGGFVLARGRLDELVPIGNAAMEDRTFIEWDKDDIDVLGLMKVDVLALGMLTCIRKSFDLLRAHENVDYVLNSVPREQKDVYDMLQKGDSIGVFQVESRAQMNMLPRLKPEKFYDLVIQVAIVRPGPIQGDMVHPYLRRRSGAEPVVFPSPAPPRDPDELHHVLKRTLGVPLFQEQAMHLAMVAAEFTDAEANGLRRAMATFRNAGTIHKFETMMVERMVARGYERAFVQRCFEQIKGFGEYGFPESHAASFAKLVYISSFIKCRYPAVFACALLNSQPMGFYAPAQIVRDAREHGVEARCVDINFSEWDNALFPGEAGGLALRLGFRQIDGMREEWARRIVAARGNGYASIESLATRARLPVQSLRILADADAFRSIDLDRREALWAARRLPDAPPLPLFAAAHARELADEPDANLPAMPLSEHVAADYQTLRLSLKSHPMAFLRDRLRREGVASCEDIRNARDGARMTAAGVVLVRQRPGKGNAIFITLEDETGIANVVLWARKFERYRREVMGARLMLVAGHVQKSPEGVVHLMAERVFDRSYELIELSEHHRTDGATTRADEILRPQQMRGRHPRDARILPKSRDFH